MKNKILPYSIPAKGKEFYIYIIFSLASTKFYIGATGNKNGREEEHFSSLENQSHDSYRLQQAYNENPNSFLFSILKSFYPKSIMDIVNIENEYINKYRLEYGDSKILNIAQSNFESFKFYDFETECAKESSFIPKIYRHKKAGKRQENKIEIIRKEIPNAYQEWTREEIEKLIRLFNDNISIKEIAKILGRKDKSISSRLRKLKLCYSPKNTNNPEIPKDNLEECYY